MSWTTVHAPVHLGAGQTPDTMRRSPQARVVTMEEMTGSPHAEEGRAIPLKDMLLRGDSY